MFRSYKHLIIQNPSLFRFISQISKPTFVLQSETTTTTTAVDFLVNSCGLSLEKASSVATKIRPNFKIKNPNSVLDYLKTSGFSKTQITNLITKCPILLFSSVDKTLKPKLQLFKESGFSDALIAELLVSEPLIFLRRLSRTVRILEIVRSFVATNEDVIRVAKRSMFMFAVGTRLESNVSILRECNVPDSRISHLVTAQPNILTLKAKGLKEAIDKVKKLGFQPEKKLFTIALQVVCSVGESTWDRKVKLLKEWGWSDDQIIDAFKRVPFFLRCSEKKIEAGLEYFSRTLNWDASLLSRYPICLMYSLKSRVMPRVEVFNILMAKEVVKTEKILIKMLDMSEDCFLNEVVIKHKDILETFCKLHDAKLIIDGETFRGFFFFMDQRSELNKW